MTTGFAQKYGPWAFIAGASTGIGAALSLEAARRGLNVLMLARGAARLEEAAQSVRQAHGVQVRTLAADLADPDIAKTVHEAVAGLEVGLFVYNAAVAPAGRFLDVSLDTHLLSVAVNCATPVALCHLLAPAMVRRGRGGIALVSSNAAIAGAVNFSTYNAGKAFEWILAETLWTELGESGVDVSTILVGATASPNYLAFQETLDPGLCGRPDTDNALDRARARLMKPNPPEQVATALYDQLGSGPVSWADPDDEFVSRQCLAMPREAAVEVWRGVQETSTRVPEKQAL
jgi:short-subunit dehydrogenase